MSERTPTAITIVSADDMDSDITASTRIDDFTKVSFHIVATNADAEGVIYLKESVDGTNYETITFDDGTSSITVTAAAAVTELKHIETFAKYVQFFYDRTSGGGAGNSCTVTLFLKD